MELIDLLKNEEGQKEKLVRQAHHKRLKNYDYSRGGYYFVTICTKNRENWFCDIVDGRMVLNRYGLVAEYFWGQIQNRYRNIETDEFVIMPNHIHGIIFINNYCDLGTGIKRQIGKKQCACKNNHATSVGTEQCSVPTRDIINTSKYGLLSKVVKSYKEKCVKYYLNHFDDYNFIWQRSFYDHVVRSDKSLNNIREYIRKNPENWEKDRNKDGYEFDQIGRLILLGK